MSEANNVPGGGIDTSLLNVNTAVVQTEKGLMNETNMTFSIPPEIANGATVPDGAALPGALSIPMRGTVDETQLVEGLNKAMGPEAASKSAARVGNIYAAVQKSMTVVDSTHNGIKLDKRTNKPLQEIKEPEFIPVGMTVVDLPADKRGAATKLTLGAK